MGAGKLLETSNINHTPYIGVFMVFGKMKDKKLIAILEHL